MIKKKSLYQGLDKIKPLIEDSSIDSPNYFRLKDVPILLTGGKNLIKVRLNNNFLELGSDIKFEILDFNGDPIHSEFTKYVAKDGESHVISIYIYNDTPSGLATMYMTGVAKYFPDGRRVSSDYSNVYNVLWKRSVLVASDKRNSTEILFDPEKFPSASIQEVVSPYLNRTFPTGTEIVTFGLGQVKYQLLQEAPTLYLEGAQFSASMVGGTLTVTTPTNPQPTPENGTVSNATYTTKIKKVLNTNNLLLSKAYTVDLNESAVKKHTYNQFDLSNYSITYKDTPTYTATQNSMSYASITLSDIEPITGDVYRVKTFRQSPGVISTWQLVDDNILESSEMLVDTTALNINKRTGLFLDASVVNQYWNIDNSDNSISPPPSMSYHIDPLNDSLKVNTTEIPDREAVRLFTTQSFDFYQKGDYVLQFDAYAEQTGSASKINIFLSGSGFDYDGTEKIKGKKIGFLNPGTSTTRYDDHQIEFEADADGKGTVIFEIEKGTWYLSEVSVKSGEETGYNPNSTTITIPIETQMLGDKLDFKFEYFDYENNQASHVTYLKDQSFVGGNTYIDGANNLLTGSMYIGREFGKGLEQSGRSSGMIRSTGYLGFTSASKGTGPAGWMMWSGSAIKDIAPGEYGGVGLDLHGGQATLGNIGASPGVLQFRTDNRQLFIKGEIRTRFDDGRTMNPPQNLPKRFILSDQTNTFRFYETGSLLTQPIVEVGSPFVTPYYLPNQEFTQSGINIVQPSEYEGHPGVQGNSVAGVVIRTERTGSGGGGIEDVNVGEVIHTPTSKTWFINSGSAGSIAFDQMKVYRADDTAIAHSTYISGSKASIAYDILSEGTNAVGINIHQTKGTGTAAAIDIVQASAGTTVYGVKVGSLSGTTRYSFYHNQIPGSGGEILNLPTYSNIITSTVRDLQIDVTGEFGYVSSDKRLKNNINPIPNSLEIVKNLNGVFFKWNETPNQEMRDIGLIAQNVQQHIPELVFENEQNGYLGVHYRKIPALLIEAIKEQQEIIEDLQTRIERLEHKL